MRFLMLGRSVGLKKKNLKQKQNKKSRNRRPWYPGMTLKVNIYIFGLTKCTIYCKKCSCCFSCFFPHYFNNNNFIYLFYLFISIALLSYVQYFILIFQIKKIISSEKWFNYVVTSLCFFFLKMTKIWVSWTTLNGEK